MRFFLLFYMVLDCSVSCLLILHGNLLLNEWLFYGKLWYSVFFRILVKISHPGYYSGIRALVLAQPWVSILIEVVRGFILNVPEFKTRPHLRSMFEFWVIRSKSIYWKGSINFSKIAWRHKLLVWAMTFMRAGII